MVLNKLHFPIYILLAILFFTVQSCKKEHQTTLKSDGDLNYSKYITLAEKHLENQIYDSAFFYFNKAKLACNVASDNDKIIYSLLKMSIIQQTQGDYSGSETSATEAIPHFQTTTNLVYKPALYNILGLNYKNIFDYTNAIYHFNQSYILTENELQKAILKNNIAIVYKDKEEYRQAIQILLTLIQKKEVINNPENYARILDNLGYCYFKIGNSKSLDFLNQSLAIREKMKGDFSVITSYISLSEFYTKTNPKLAYQFALKAYKKATKINTVNDRLKSLVQLIKISSGNQLKIYSEKYIRINDSIVKVRQKARNQFAKIKYDSKKEKEENLLLKTQKAEAALELEQQKNSNLLLLFITLIGVLSTVFLYYFLKSRNKKEKIQTAYETETRISKRLHDELANDVYNTMTFAETQDLNNTDKKEIFLNQIETIYNRTRNISLENSEIDTSEHFKENLLMLISGYNDDKTNIIIKNQEVINWNKTKIITKITVYRIVQELLVNMKKHSQCSLVVIGFETKGKTYEITYTDNGIGSSKTLKFKNGLQNVGNRIKTINGTFTFDTETNKGFKSKIIFPH